MPHFKISYEPQKRKLIIYHNDKILGGMIGPIAEERYNAIKGEIDEIDVLKHMTNGHKAKKAAI